ncbi:MAG: hypothetical protein ACYC35_00675 [Pirellulales bacterium]
MSTALQTVDLTQLPSTQLGTDEQFEELSRSTGFLGRLQLFSKGNAINEGLIPPGTYGIPESDKKIVKLGPQIDILPLARRLKALDLSDKEAIISNYDPASDDFKDIAARSNESDSGCMYGTSFLIFERSTGRFLELFCGSKSTRPIAGDIAVFLPLSKEQIEAKKAAGSDVSQMKAHGPLPCTLKVRLAKNKRGHSWHVPDAQTCSVPFQNLPETTVIVDEMNKFTHPGATEVETVKEDASKKSRAR